jgi:CheY-like chemotaxis protein
VTADRAPAPEAYEVNQRLALVCVDDLDRKAEVSAALQELGYRIHLPASPLDAIDRMRKNPYEVVVIDETFQGATPHDNPVLMATQAMAMNVRRYMYVVLLVTQAATFDNMTAFAKSVNLVVNVNDLAQTRAILERGIADNEQFYRVFRQVLQEAGRR